ncbi:MAG: hypothetical protein ABL986_07820 [Vicinamibacterales bacterium]
MPAADSTTLAVLAVVLALASWAALSRRARRPVRGLALLTALVGSFYLYLVLSPAAPTNAVVSIGLFVGSAMLFRLLSTFEQ